MLTIPIFLTTRKEVAIVLVKTWKINSGTFTGWKSKIGSKSYTRAKTLQRSLAFFEKKCRLPLTRDAPPGITLLRRRSKALKKKEAER